MSLTSKIVGMTLALVIEKKNSSIEARMPFGWVLFMKTDCLDEMEKKEALVAS